MIPHAPIPREVSDLIGSYGTSVAAGVWGPVVFAYVLKKIGVTEDIHCGLIIYKNVRGGDGAVVLVKIFGVSSTSYTPFILSQCGEGGFQVYIGGSVG